MAVHELGHVIGAVLTKGKVLRVILHPAAISRTEISPNPSPLTVAWMGPILGCLVPCLVLLAMKRIWQRSQRPVTHQPSDGLASALCLSNVRSELPGGRVREIRPPASLRVLITLLQFFAGFCLLSNGAYLGFGVFEQIGDAGDILKAGSPPWLPIAFGLIASVSGLLMWHQLGSPRLLLQYRNGFNPWLIRGLCSTLALIVVVECLFSST